MVVGSPDVIATPVTPGSALSRSANCRMEVRAQIAGVPYRAPGSCTVNVSMPSRVEAERGVRHRPETAREEPGGGEKAQAERDLPGDQHAAQAAACARLSCCRASRRAACPAGSPGRPTAPAPARTPGPCPAPART